MLRQGGMISVSLFQMNVTSERVMAKRHPWLIEFECSPAASFADLIAGYAEISPFERADVRDTARALFGSLSIDDPARTALQTAIIGWLDKRRRLPFPVQPHLLQRHIREVVEVFDIVALLEVADVAVWLRREHPRWTDWTTNMVLSNARDARAAFWRMLALTQAVVASTDRKINGSGLVPMWHEICREAGTTLPDHYLSIGLLGIRRLPAGKGASDVAWVSGLAQWAAAREPTDTAFKAEWMALKSLYPRAPQRWREVVRNALAQYIRDGEERAYPAWWRVDPEIAVASASSSKVPHGTAFSSPLPEDCRRVVEKLKSPLRAVEPQVTALLNGYRRYLAATGHSEYFVRAIHMLGRALISHSKDEVDDYQERALLAEEITREGLGWEPFNRHLWSLWREALEAQGRFEDAELVGWERVRRDPTDVNARNQLAILLANGLGRYEEAETLLRETIAQFPDDAVARNELAELLIFLDRTEDAYTVSTASFEEGVTDLISYSLMARLYCAKGDQEKAKEVLTEGRTKYPDDQTLAPQLRHVRSGKLLSLRSGTFRPIDAAVPMTEATGSVVRLDEIARMGKLRYLRFRLESCLVGRKGALWDAGRAELEQILTEDPTFAYAQILAARQGIWKAKDQSPPPFGAAFETAFASDDRATLQRLAEHWPRLAAITRVAQARLGDPEAAAEIQHWLETEAPNERSLNGLHRTLRPLLRLVDGGLDFMSALSAERQRVDAALYDANEAALMDFRLVA